MPGDPTQHLPDTLDEASLLRANQRFYDVFETLSYERMAGLWEKSPRSFCVHPGWPPLRGSEAVLASWRDIIGHTPEIHFRLSDPRAVLNGTEGIVTVIEYIYNVRGEFREGSSAISTNIFAFDEKARMWRIYHHHGSHMESMEMPPEVLPS